jgi:hypothetical protein
MQSTDDFYKKLIKPIRDKHVSKVIASIDSSTFSPYDQQLNWQERLSPVKQLREQFTEWSKSQLHGLDKFPYMYVMNGNTDYLNLLFNKIKNLAWKKGDYSYYSYWHSAAGLPLNELEHARSVQDFLVSWPGYSHGDQTELDFALACNADRLHLDCAYLGLVKPAELDVSIFETASFSFSKTLAIPYNRISIMFSKTEIPEIALLNRLGYVNLAGVRLVNQLLDNISIDYWWETYGSNRLLDLCRQHDLTATKSILFAYEKEKRIGLATYWNLNG